MSTFAIFPNFYVDKRGFAHGAPKSVDSRQSAAGESLTCGLRLLRETAQGGHAIRESVAFDPKQLWEGTRSESRRSQKFRRRSHGSQPEEKERWGAGISSESMVKALHLGRGAELLPSDGEGRLVEGGMPSHGEKSDRASIGNTLFSINFSQKSCEHWIIVFSFFRLEGCGDMRSRISPLFRLCSHNCCQFQSWA